MANLSNEDLQMLYLLDQSQVPILNSKEVAQIKRAGVITVQTNEMKNKQILRVKITLAGIAILTNLIMSGKGHDVAQNIFEYLGWFWLAFAGQIEPNIYKFFVNKIGIVNQRKILWHCTNYMENIPPLSQQHLLTKIGLTHAKKLKLKCPLDMLQIQKSPSPHNLMLQYYNASAYYVCETKVDEFRYKKSDFIAKFNPVFDIVILFYINEFQVLAFAGDERNDGGMLMYEYIIPRCDDHLVSVEWSPDGKYILCIETDQIHYQKNLNDYNEGGRRITVFKYDNFSKKIRKLANTSETLKMSALQSSNCLWINSNSFLFPVGFSYPLLKATIKKKSLKIETIISKCCDVRSEFFFKNSTTESFTNWIPLYSGFFFTGLGFEPLLFWITNCIENVRIYYYFIKL